MNDDILTLMTPQKVGNFSPEAKAAGATALVAMTASGALGAKIGRFFGGERGAEIGAAIGGLLGAAGAAYATRPPGGAPPGRA